MERKEGGRKIRGREKRERKEGGLKREARASVFVHFEGNLTIILGELTEKEEKIEGRKER